jgi:hypothetical protein
MPARGEKGGEAEISFLVPFDFDPVVLETEAEGRLAPEQSFELVLDALAAASIVCLCFFIR